MTVKESEQVALRYFRSWPDSLSSRSALHSSLQSLETSLLLVAEERFPHALVNCASALESALKAAPSLRVPSSAKAADLFQGAVAALTPFELKDVDAFRRARNQYVHAGFAPDDEKIAARLLLETGFPFLRASYEEFFGFDFVDSLVVQLGEQLRISLDVYQMARNIPGLDFSYCFSAFGHLIRWSAGQARMASWEYEASVRAGEIGKKYEDCEQQRGELERLFGAAWFFDCPICHEPEMLVGELDENNLDAGKVMLNRAACPSCRLIVRGESPYLADSLCQAQIAREQGTILREFGITN
ncbi:MAG: hypothetical protein ACJ8GN_27870 [Longimicrobiaceae bacterium]